MSATVSLRYDPAEDRLLLHLGEVDSAGSESVQGLWLTRRVCAAWRKDLQAMIDMSAQAPSRLDPAAKAAVTQAHHQAMAMQAATRTEPKQSKLESARKTEPQLVTKVLCGRRKGDGRWVLQFERPQGTPVLLTVGDATLHGLVEALNSRLKIAAWNLDAMPVEREVQSPPGPGASLH